MDDQAVAEFAAHRRQLVRAAYRVLGDNSRAEDVVQEAWLRWTRVDPGTVRNPRGFLYQTVTRLAIDELRKVAVRNEVAVASGELSTVDPIEGVELAESVEGALRLVMQSLSPVERAAFLLHEVFGFSNAEIASITGRTDHAARQLVYRARRKVRAGRPRYEPTRQQEAAILQRFQEVATSGGDFLTLAAACSS
ncbi:sigma-70 family RNA polymerase sigma factor [Kribbella sp. NPDC048928]|uniref:sigma-70 family RNA polymerase sigma factor n=1 Tax=Kribbella sp. NPDC048928 TaxID=3364111 RepID=UPI00370FDAB9